jgi:hypothetical protein
VQPGVDHQAGGTHRVQGALVTRSAVSSASGWRASARSAISRMRATAGTGSRVSVQALTLLDGGRKAHLEGAGERFSDAPGQKIIVDVTC